MPHDDTSAPMPRQARRATLKDVAAEAGVDASTVSKVLRGGTRIKVRPSTRANIEAAVEKLGYRANASARSLRDQRTRVIGMLMPHSGNPLYATIIDGAKTAAERLGYLLLVAGLNDQEQASPDAYWQLAHEQRVDGLIIGTALPTAAAFIPDMHLSLPHVFVNRVMPGSQSNVVLDDEAGMRLVVEALHALGHSRIGLIDGLPELTTAASRTAAARRVCADLGLDEPVSVVGFPGPEQAYQATREILRQSGTTALFVASAYAALGCYACAADAGLVIGRDLAVITYEDLDLGRSLRPRLAAVGMPYRELGDAATCALVAHLDGTPPRDVVVRTVPTLTPGASLCRAPAARG